MKNRILCVILSVILGIGAFSSSISPVSISASANGAMGLAFIYAIFVNFFSTVFGNIISENMASFNEDDKFELLIKIRDLLKDNNVDFTADYDNIFQFLSDMYQELPDNDDMISRYGDDWSTVHGEYHPIFARLSIYGYGIQNIMDWLQSHYNDDNTQLDDDGNPQIPADDFKDMIKDRDVYYPTGNFAKYSYRKLSDNYFNTAKNANVKYFCGPVVKVGEEFTVLMYMERNGKTYYSPFQYHFTCRTETVPADFTIGGEDRSRIHYKYYCDVTYYKSINGEPADNYDMGYIGEVTSQWKSYTYKDEITNSTKTGYKEHFPAYIVLGCGYDNNSLINLAFYETTSDASISSGSFGNIYPGSLTSCDIELFAKTYNYLICSSDTSDYYLSNGKFDYNGETRYGLGHFFGSKSVPGSLNQNLVPISSHDYGDEKHPSIVICDEGHTCDFGYLVSSSSFGSTTTIDTSLIPDNATVTLTGDDLSKYVVTYNNGDTITIGQLIYGGYTPSGGGDTTTSGSVGIGGDVNVGGHVDVSGNVNVNGTINGQINVSIPDINVNVNGGGGTNIDTSMPNLDAVQGYLDEANSESSDFKSFLKDFFSFLPNDILLLLLIALSVCIVCRIVGR